VDKIIDNRFEIIDELGEGGMGKVWLATDRQTSRIVAFKLLLEFSKDRQTRLDREISIIRELTHESVVKFVANGIYNDLPYIVTEFVAGRPISIEEGIEKNIRYMCKILDALGYIHSKGIVHRDIKPTNIVVAGDQAILMDFGVALDVNLDRLTESGNVVGTIAYMSPEQLFGQVVDYRTDIYSAGIVLYELVTGKHPFQGNHFPDVVSMITTTKPEAPHSLSNDVPEQLSKIIMKMLEKAPEKRQQSTAEVRDALSDYIDGNSIQAQEVSIDPPFTYPFIGRQNELLKFGTLLKELRLGKGFTLNVNGPVGIGKTKLLFQMMSMALSRSTKFIIVNQDNTASDMPALSSLLDSISEYDAFCDVELSSMMAHEARQYSPAFANKLCMQTEAPKKNIENLHHAFAKLIVSCFGGKPVVFAFEDNIDAFTKNVAKELAILSMEKNIGIVINTNTQDNAIQNLPSSTHVMELSSLGAEDIRQIAESVIGTDKATKKILDEIAEKSKGYPLIGVSLALQYNDSKDNEFLKKIRDKTSMIFTSSFQMLSEESKTIVETMSLMTFPVNSEQLQAILGLSTEKMINCVMELRHSGLTTERFNGLRMLFEIASPVVRLHIENQIPPDKKQALHNLIAISTENKDTHDDPIFRCEAAKHFIYCSKPKQAIDIVLSATKELMEANRPLIVEKYLKLIFPLIDIIGDIRKSYELLTLYLEALYKNNSMIDISPLIMQSYNIIKNEKFDNESKLGLSLGISRLAISLGRYDIISEFTEYGLKFVDKSTKDRDVAELHMHVAYSELQNKKTDQKKMLKYAKSSISFAQKSKDKKMIMESIGTFANFLSYTGKYDEANNIYIQTEETAREHGLNDALLVTLHNHSVNLTKQGNFDKAMEKCNEVVTASKDFENSHYLFLGLQGIVRCHTASQRFRDAAVASEEIVEFTKKYDSTKVPPWAFIFPCKYQLNYMKLDQLDENANRMLGMAKIIGKIYLVSYASYFLAELDYIRKDYLSAINRLNDLIHSYSVDILLAPERLFGDLSKYYSANNQPEEAISVLGELEKLLSKQGIDDDRKKLLEKTLFIAEANVFFNTISSNNYSYELKKRMVEKIKKNRNQVPQIEQLNAYSSSYELLPTYQQLPEIAYARGLNHLSSKMLEIDLDKKQNADTLSFLEQALEFMLKHGFKRLWNELTTIRVEIMKVFEL
jgi:serine/threonine protein kinase